MVPLKWASGAALKANTLWKQMVADVLNCSLAVEPASELTSRGVAVMMHRAMRSGGRASALPVEAFGDGTEMFEQDMVRMRGTGRAGNAGEVLRMCGKSWLIAVETQTIVAGQQRAALGSHGREDGLGRCCRIRVCVGLSCWPG